MRLEALRGGGLDGGKFSSIAASMAGLPSSYLNPFGRSPYPRGTPEIEHRRSMVHPGTTPAEPCDRAGNASRRHPKRSPNRPRDPPRSTPGAPKTTKKRQKSRSAKKCRKKAQQNDSFFWSFRLAPKKGLIFGTPWGGPPVSWGPKKAVWAKKACARNVFFPLGAGKYRKRRKSRN